MGLLHIQLTHLNIVSAAFLNTLNCDPCKTLQYNPREWRKNALCLISVLWSLCGIITLWSESGKEAKRRSLIRSVQVWIISLTRDHGKNRRWVLTETQITLAYVNTQMKQSRQKSSSRKEWKLENAKYKRLRVWVAVWISDVYGGMQSLGGTSGAASDVQK